MVKTILAMGGATAAASAASTSVFLPIGMSGTVNALTESADWQYHRVTKPGKLTNFAAYAHLNQRAAASVTLIVNGVASALTVTFPASAYGWVVDTTHEVDVVAGDLVCVRLDTGTGSNAILIRQLSCDFEASDGTITQWLGGRTLTTGSPNPINNQVRHFPILGSPPWIPGTSPDGVKIKMPQPGKLLGLFVHVAANTLNEPLMLAWDGSTVAISPVLTIPAGTTGRFYLSGEMAFAAGDLISLIQYTASLVPTGGIQIPRIGMEVEWSNNFIVGNWYSAGANAMVGSARYVPGSATSWDTETNRQFRIQTAATLVALHAGNSETAASGSVITARKNATNIGVSVAPGAANTWSSSSGHSVAFSSGDLASITANPTGAYNNGVNALLLEFYAAGTVTVDVNTSPGSLKIGGNVPNLIVDEFVITAPGALTITGNAPLIASTQYVDVEPGALEFTGTIPSLFLGIGVDPAPGAMILSPGAPEVLIYTEAASLASQIAALAIGEVIPAARTSQVAVLALGEVVPPVAVSQQAVLILADAHPCVSRLCQVWLLRRKDGVELAFTSHDEPVKFMGHTFTPCASLNPSAVEAASDMAAVGNMELTGIIDAEGITEFDLYAGKFDDCRVDVWEIPWAGAFPHPIRLASGTTGAVSHGRDGFKGEVLGPGAKMQQQAITQVVTAACRFTFGDARCAKDIGPLTRIVSVAAVAASAPFRTFRADALIGSGPEGYFSRGVVTWTSGANIGVRSEVKEYDPATGTVVLWNLLPSPASAGDAFTISPGCSLAKDGDMGCVYWGNLINFGGFPDVPGDDATAETPIAKV